AFNSATACSEKWNTDAASAASARPVVNTSWKCSNVPAPPDAITGIETADDTAAVSSQSKPLRVPSRSIDLSKTPPPPPSRAPPALGRPAPRLPPRPTPAAPRVALVAIVLALRVDGDDDRLRTVPRGETCEQ